MKTTELGLGYKVESWWDRQSRVWITVLKDGYDHQLGGCLLSGTRGDMEFDHAAMITDSGRRRLDKLGEET